MRLEDGGSAFPFDSERHVDGMSLRDYFAAHVISGIVPITLPDEIEAYAQYAYALADAMLKERNK